MGLGDTYFVGIDTSLSFPDPVSLRVPRVRALELVFITQSGPFAERTVELGRYIGIRQDDRLVAMAGERFKVNRYTEISAVCTLPDYHERGYATALSSILRARSWLIVLLNLFYIYPSLSKLS